MARALKAYLHDAYVAAPSMKAALAAWGTDKDLFARKAAELVEDRALTAEPLANPGKVIRVPRGSAAEHVKALGKIERRVVPRPPSGKREAARKPPPKAMRPPRPSDEAVRLARDAARVAELRHEARLAELAKRETKLAAERARLEREWAAEALRHEQHLVRAKDAYAAALKDWNEG